MAVDKCWLAIATDLPFYELWANAIFMQDQHEARPAWFRMKPNDLFPKCKHELHFFVHPTLPSTRRKQYVGYAIFDAHPRQWFALAPPSLAAILADDNPSLVGFRGNPRFIPNALLLKRKRMDHFGGEIGILRNISHQFFNVMPSEVLVEDDPPVRLRLCA